MLLRSRLKRTAFSIFKSTQINLFKFLMFFLLGKKEPKTQGERPTSLFYPTKANALPPKKMQFTLFRQKQPHYYQRMIHAILKEKKH